MCIYRNRQGRNDKTCVLYFSYTFSIITIYCNRLTLTFLSVVCILCENISDHIWFERLNCKESEQNLSK